MQNLCNTDVRERDKNSLTQPSQNLSPLISKRYHNSVTPPIFLKIKIKPLLNYWGYSITPSLSYYFHKHLLCRIAHWISTLIPQYESHSLFLNLTVHRIQYLLLRQLIRLHSNHLRSTYCLARKPFSTDLLLLSYKDRTLWNQSTPTQMGNNSFISGSK